MRKFAGKFSIVISSMNDAALTLCSWRCILSLEGENMEMYVFVHLA